MYLTLTYALFLFYGFSIIATMSRILLHRSYNRSRLFANGGGGGGKGGGKDGGGQQYMMPPPAPTPVAPTADSQTVADAVTAEQRRRAAADGTSSTDVTKGTLSGDPATLNKAQPTLLGG